MLCFLAKVQSLVVDDSTCTKRARVVFSLSCPESQVGSNPAKKFSTLASSASGRAPINQQGM